MPSLTMLALATTLAVANPAPLATPEQTKAICGEAASKFGDNDSDAAFALLGKHWTLPAEEVTNLAYQTKSQLGMVAGRFGAPIGAEHVRTSMAGQSYLSHVFLIKYENHALRFTCTFYRPRETWVVNAVLWDDKVQQLFD